MFFFFFQAEDGIRDADVTGVQTCALPISAMTRRMTAALVLAGAILTSGCGRISRPPYGGAPELELVKEIGRASCRERVWIWVGGVSLKKKTFCAIGASCLEICTAIHTNER